MGNALSGFIADDRSNVETFLLLVGRDPKDARAIAEADLRDNPHHKAVEVRDGETLILVLTREDLFDRSATFQLGQHAQPNSGPLGLHSPGAW
jgi:hypothetical protein